MAKFKVDAEDLKPFVERREGSIPSLATKKLIRKGNQNGHRYSNRFDM